MDEPCSALDPIATLKIEELIDELKTRYTIIIVTHNMQQAARVADKTAFMLSGELVEFDDTNKIFTSPADPRTEDDVTGKFGLWDPAGSISRRSCASSSCRRSAESTSSS